MAQTIQFRRGNENNLPSLAPGEPAVTLDTEKLFIGTPQGNVAIPKQAEVDQLSLDSSQKVKKNDLVINVKDFGAKGDGVTDDTAAIQAAVDAVNGGSGLVGQTGLTAINSIYFPPGDYIINNTITIGEVLTGGLMFYGHGAVRDTRMGARLLTNVTGSVFVARKYGVTFKNLSFYHKGTPKAVGTVAVEMMKLTDSDDAELEVIGCTMDNYETGVKHEGRSLKVTDTAIVACKYGISLSWTPNGQFASRPNHTDMQFGFRAFHFSHNRFHMTEYAIYNSGRLNNDQIRSVVISNNVCDLGTKLFYGALNFAVIEGNVVDLPHTLNLSAIVHVVGGGKNITIVGNTFTGYNSSGDNVPARAGRFGIKFDVLAHGCTISGNSFSGFADCALDIAQGATGSVITNNTLADNNTALRLNGTYTSSIVVNQSYTGNSTMNGGVPTFTNDSRWDIRGVYVPTVTSANAYNNHFFYDSTDGKLKFKTSTGTVLTVTTT